ncbi:Rv3235 family protein [Bifidobacterium avesanii]|uniref:Uncharacterized protein n=1 Tax=Bifidobacterium avesanii TaxID=1798157 RepID=A0A7K3TEH6_9BIFI|nr:Rv3235 family protein [Bifidobacterium avesanii]KAB8295491.1 hypothetical protein DSM100685_0101 [Bifidobacterium avesanii]NEG77497.1 hypothetical protein [Bifidobacterium avesanii]
MDGNAMDGVSDSFEVDVNLTPQGEPIPVRVRRYVARDMSRRDGIGLAAAAAQLACRAMEIVRGRLDADKLVRAATMQTVRKLGTMALLYRSHLQRHPELKRRTLSLPVEAKGVDAVVRSADHVEAWVRLNVGRTDYWSTVVFDYVGGRWLCTTLDLG